MFSYTLVIQNVFKSRTILNKGSVVTYPSNSTVVSFLQQLYLTNTPTISGPFKCEVLTETNGSWDRLKGLLIEESRQSSRRVVFYRFGDNNGLKD